jgi:hypothetical protein
MPRSPRQDDRLLRSQRLGQELAGDGHDLCRGTAAVCREPERLRPAVRQSDAEAEGRSIDGLSPAIAIEQKNLGHTPRSTVGTVTEIYDYLRILLARWARPLPDVRYPDRHADLRPDRRQAAGADLGGTQTTGIPTRSHRWQDYPIEKSPSSIVARDTTFRSWSTESPCDKMLADRGQCRARLWHSAKGSDARCVSSRGSLRKSVAGRPTQPVSCLRRLRNQLRAAWSAELFVQQSARLVPRL